MKRTAFTAIASLVLAAACGSHAPTTPSSTAPPPTTGSGNAPTAAIDVKADAAGSRDAIASLSEVVVDASASTGTGLTFAIDFGDGATATTASAKHVYAAPSTYTVTVTVTDSQSRKATSSKDIAVRDVTGNWFQAGFVAKTNRVEVRNLTIDAQTGTTVRGTYRVTGDTDRAFTGTLTPPRDIHLTAGSVSLEGTLPGRVNDEATLWTLIAHGDSADGQRLDFRAITSAPDDGAPPDADLRLFMDGGGLFDMPIPSLTPVRFDAGASRGSGLSYFIEFGDGTASAGAQATRTVETSALARLTVVDRFGRSNTESVQYYTFALGDSAGDRYWMGTVDGKSNLGMSFTTRNGVNYTGRSWSNCGGDTPDCPYFPNAPLTATVSGVRTIRISVPSRGVTYEGSFVLVNGNIRMSLVQSGGTQNGKTWTMVYRDSY